MKPSLLKPVRLSIPTPCQQDWTTMQTAEDGRFCSACAKTVIDFTGLSDEEVLRYFQSSASIRCGRFYTSQLNRTLQPPPPKRKPSVLLYKRIAAVLAFLTLKSITTTAQEKPPTTTQLVNKKSGLDSVAKPAIVSGTVTDDSAIGLANAIVKLNGKEVATTDTSGQFTFTIDNPVQPAVLDFSYPNLVTVARSYHPAMGSTSYTIQLHPPAKLHPITMGAPVIDAVAIDSFEFDRPVEGLTNDLRRRLSDLGTELRNKPNASINLITFSNKKGEKEAMRLGRAFRDYLIEREGISGERIFIQVQPLANGKANLIRITNHED